MTNLPTRKRAFVRRDPVGCSPEMASAIVRLLQEELSPELLPAHRDKISHREPPLAAPVEPAPSERTRAKRSRKVTPAIAQLLCQHRELTPAQLVAMVKDKHGVSICESSVYNTWRSA